MMLRLAELSQFIPQNQLKRARERRKSNGLSETFRQSRVVKTYYLGRRD
jgi:hypothetical protein